jgi:NDP-sugar pyrophosphorylase family protein
VLSSIDLARMAQFHAQHNALATLAVADRQTSRPLLFSAQGHLLGRGSSTNPSDVILSESAGAQTMDAQAEGAPGPSPSGIGESTNVANTNSEAALAFGGIHVISPRIFDQLGEDGAFSIIDAYIRLAANGETILGFRSDGAYWRDLGRPDDLTAAERDMASGRYPAG